MIKQLQTIDFNYIIPKKKNRFIVSINIPKEIKFRFCSNNNIKELKKILENKQNVKLKITECIYILENIKKEITKLRKVVRKHNKKVDDLEYKIMFDNFVKLLDYLSKLSEKEKELIHDFKSGEIKRIISRDKYIIIRKSTNKEYINYVILKDKKEIQKVEN